MCSILVKIIGKNESPTLLRPRNVSDINVADHFHSHRHERIDRSDAGLNHGKQLFHIHHAEAGQHSLLLNRGRQRTSKDGSLPELVHFAYLFSHFLKSFFSSEVVRYAYCCATQGGMIANISNL